MRIAVVHDYFTQFGGAEKVAEELYRIMPNASLFTTVAFRNCMPSLLKEVDVHSSWMQLLPKIEKHYRLYFLLYPLAVRSLDLSPYDLVLSSSSGYAKGVQTNPDAVHVCYCHTPMRWVWSYAGYSRRESFGFGERALLPMLIRGLKCWDEEAARQPDHFVANSRVVAERIRRAYNRTAEVIHPPIDVERFHPCAEFEDYYVVLSRLVSYKRIDLAVLACSQRGKKLLVIGKVLTARTWRPWRVHPFVFWGASQTRTLNMRCPVAEPCFSPEKKTSEWLLWRSPPLAGLPLLIAPGAQPKRS